MTAICITPPAALPVDLEVAKTNMRVDGDAMDALITNWIKGIVAKLEHEIGQCLMEQTWRVTLDGFPAPDLHEAMCGSPRQCVPAINLPHPVGEILTVRYIDQAGDEQLLDPAAYRLQRGRYQSVLLPARGTAWPATLADTDVVTIDLVCGYGQAPDAVPANIQLYILAKLVEQFDPITRMERDTVQSAFVDGLLDACRSYA